MSRDTPSSSPSAAAPSHDQTIAARIVALEILGAIFEKGTALDVALSDAPSYQAINTLDRALVRMMVMTTLRRLGQIDDMIAYAMDTDEPPDPPALQALLRLSVAQLIFMDIPDHAAVSVAVDTAVRAGLARQKGLVNAVLRRLAREGRDITTRQDIARLNVPSWMLAAWTKSYGAAPAGDIARASLKEAPLDVTLKNPAQADSYAQSFGAKILPCGSLRLKSAPGPIDQMPGFATGDWWVQDASASVPVRLMGDVSGARVLDMCAAPGGKTAQLASAGAQVTALDSSAARLKTLHENITRLGLKAHVDVQQGDALTYDPAKEFDFVLLDAPCSATGTLRRHPDILLHRSSDDVLRMTGLQTRLIARGLQYVRRGGRLIYAVCSLQTEEGEAHVARTLSAFPNVRVLPPSVQDCPWAADWITSEGGVRILPTDQSKLGGMDGFYTVMFEKV